MKTALITGASAGFGKATAELLASKGYKLILMARRAERLAELKESLGTPVHTIAVDVQDAKAVTDAIAALPEDFVDVDILVNNAGLARGTANINEGSMDDWNQMIDTNIKGLLHVTRAVVPIMKERNEGTIVNIGSNAALAPYKGGNVYGATKAFVRQLTRNMRTDLLGSQIRVSVIEPGAAETEFSDVRFGGDTEKAATVYKGMRPLSAEDVAETIVWVIERPAHVNIDAVDIMPTDQTWGGVVKHTRS